MPYRLDNSITTADIEATSASAGLNSLRQEVASKLAQLVVGQQLNGEVLSRQKDGSFNVQVANLSVRMQLPEGVHEGDSVSLRLISTDPRPTFALESRQQSVENFITEQTYTPGKKTLSDFSASPQPRLEETNKLVSAKAILQATTGPLAPDSGIHTDSSVTTLSNASKLIGTILQADNDNAESSAIVGKTAILNTQSDLNNIEKTAVLLEKKISQSGLFYESHLAEWIDGKKNISDLKTEPQSVLSALSQNVSGEENSLISGNKEIIQLIQQQLRTLEDQSIRWQGELFPGQYIKWEIKREKPSEQTKGSLPEDNIHWQSTVKFDLPSLGVVSATFNFHANHLSLSINAEKEDTVNTLRTYAGQLSSSLSSLDTILDSLSVRKDDSK